MSDSVGKISLDLEVQSDLQGQISNMSNLIGKRLKGALESTTKGTLNNMDKGIKNSLNSINSSIKNTFSSMKNNLRSLFASFKNIKMPSNFGLPKNQTSTGKNATSNITSRGPPVMGEALNAKILNVSATLDTVNAKIEQQQEKLSQLRESYSQTFNQVRKNKLQEQMLRTEATINKLIGQSDKLGFQLADLDSQSSAAATGTSKLAKSMKSLENNTKKAGNSLRSSHSGLSMFLGTMVKWGIIFPIIQRGITTMATGLLNNLKTNQAFANSLAVIKTNLQVAFTPIFNVILPAINALMSGLATITTYIASFISSLFGKTYKSSFEATQGLIDAKTAMGAYGDTAQAAGKKAKGALAGFDEINSLNMQDDSSSGGSGGSGGGEVPTLTMPQIDTSAVDSSMKKLTDRIKAFIGSINFIPLIDSFNNLKAAAEPIIDNLGKILKWFMNEILAPLTVWTIQDFIPAFFNLLAGALDFLNPILTAFMSVGQWLWDNFLQPIAAWTGGVIVDVLNWFADALTRIGEWMTNHQGIVETFIIILGSFALAWGAVTLATTIWAGVTKLVDKVSGGLGKTLGFITSKMGLTVLAIGAIIAIGVLLYKNWDVIKAKCAEVWTWVQAKFQAFDSWLTSIFTTDWTRNFGIFGNILNAFSANVSNIWNGVKKVFGGIIDFVAGIFTGNWSRAWNGVKNIFKGIFDMLVGIAKAPINMIIGLINGMISAINVAIRGINRLSWDVPSWVPIIGGQHWGFNISQIGSVPYLAKGGIIDSPTLAMVGEAGREAVIPLQNNRGGIQEIATLIASMMPQGNTNNGFGDGDIILMIDGSVIGKVALKQLRKMQRQGNVTLIPT